MTDVHGELLKCVLQLAACSDKVCRWWMQLPPHVSFVL
jgi:hypothetical protein